MSEIEFNTYKKNEYKTGAWSGGTTTELAIYPADCQYSERKFIWRLSSATVEIEESDFTPLPDYNRVLIVLNGEVVLVHKEIRVARLAQYEQDRFSGAYETKSFGQITDFNLMVKKENQGFAEVVTLTNENLPLKVEKFNEYNKISQGFYCTEGFCVINVNKQSFMIKEGELLVVNCNYGDINEMGIMGEGKTIWTHVYFNDEDIDDNIDQKSETAQEKIKAKITFEDIKLAAIVCWSNFRGGKCIFRSLKDTWYDEELQKGIDKIERIFIPFLIWLVGIGVVGFNVWNRLQNPQYTVTAIVFWIFIDLLIINPLIYLAILPRPIKSHIKKITELTESEKAEIEKKKAENKQADKILKKYEITGRNKYID